MSATYRKPLAAPAICRWYRVTIYRNSKRGATSDHQGTSRAQAIEAAIAASGGYGKNGEPGSVDYFRAEELS